MALRLVDWVLAIHYGPSAHRATYGRLAGPPNTYTKDYIQLSRDESFLNDITRLFPSAAGANGTSALTYKWPGGETPGALIRRSSDRPHLSWVTSLGAPAAWRMRSHPKESTAETIPGNPNHRTVAQAESEFEQLGSRGAGQPYLLAIKLRDEPSTLHVRAYLRNPSSSFANADLRLTPPLIQSLATRTSQRDALAWSSFQGGGTPVEEAFADSLARLSTTEDPQAVIASLDAEAGRALATYLRHPGHGLFFDPSKNHDAWSQPADLPATVASSLGTLIAALDARFPLDIQSDAAAEAVESDPAEVENFREQIAQRDFSVDDATATMKTRGSAQKAFSDAVKKNYEYRCAITGLVTRDFLVASHIVPWSKDQSIRLDPSNGICLSSLVDRAFEKGYLLIDDDLTVRIDWGRVGGDTVLNSQLTAYDGITMTAPALDPPQPDYLQRRRALVTRND